MEASLQIPVPVALARPRGAHRFDVFSPKLSRRLTLYRRCAFDQWVLIETDPFVQSFCERPGYLQVSGHRHLADFWVSYADRAELVVLPNAVRGEDADPHRHSPSDDSIDVRVIRPAELAASRMWIDNWKRTLPTIVVTRGLVPTSLLNAVEAFLAGPQPLLAVERGFSGGDPILARAATFRLLYDGHVTAPELRTDPLCPTTRFAAVGRQ